MMDKDALRHLLPQLIATLLGSLMVISDGMTYGWTSPMIPYFKSNQTHIHVTDYNIEWMETIVLFGGIAGLPFTFLGVHYLRRKKCVIISAFVGCICWIMLLIATNLEVLYTARFFSGMANNMCFVATPMYIAEIADHRVRGFLSALMYLMMLAGIVIVYAAGSLASYHVVPAIGIVLTACQVVFFPFMPESPYYLVYIDQKEEARKSLARLRGASANIDSEMSGIEQAVRRQKTEKGRPQDIILIDSNRRALLIMLILNGCQNFAGNSVMLMNLHVILDEAGSVYMTSSTAAIIFSVIMLCFAAIVSSIIDKFGRKKLLMISSLLTGLTLLCAAIYFNLKNAGYDVVFVSWIPAVCVMIYAATFRLGLGLVPIVVAAEIFPTTIKAMGMTIADVINVIASVISIFVYTALYENYGMHVPFYLFAICSFSTICFTFFLIPETKGKTLDEIQLKLKGIKSEDFKKNIQEDPECHSSKY